MGNFMNKKISFLCASVLAATSVAASADQGGVYAGIGLGQARYDVSAGDIDAAAVAAGFSSSSSSVDDTGNAWKIFAGYKFSQHFGIEGGWVDLGKVEIDTTTTGPAATVDSEIEAQGLFVDAVGFLPINSRFTLYGKVGLVRADVEARVAAVSGGSAVTVDADDDSFEAKLGVGVSYDFNDRFGARLEYERYNDVGDDDTGEGDVDLLMLGIYMRF